MAKRFAKPNSVRIDKFRTFYNHEIFDSSVDITIDNPKTIHHINNEILRHANEADGLNMLISDNFSHHPISICEINRLQANKPEIFELIKPAIGHMFHLYADFDQCGSMGDYFLDTLSEEISYQRDDEDAVASAKEKYHEVESIYVNRSSEYWKSLKKLKSNSILSVKQMKEAHKKAVNSKDSILLVKMLYLYLIEHSLNGLVTIDDCYADEEGMPLSYSFYICWEKYDFFHDECQNSIDNCSMYPTLLVDNEGSKLYNQNMIKQAEYGFENFVAAAFILDKILSKYGNYIKTK